MSASKAGDVVNFVCDGIIRQKKCIQVIDGVYKDGKPYHTEVWQMIGADEEKAANRAELDKVLRQSGYCLHSINGQRCNTD